MLRRSSTDYFQAAHKGMAREGNATGLLNLNGAAVMSQVKITALSTDLPSEDMTLRSTVAYTIHAVTVGCTC